MHGCGFHYGYYGGPRWMCVVKHSVSTPHCWQNRWLKFTWSHTSRNRGSQAVPKRSSLIFTNALAMGKSKGLEFRGTLRLWPNTTTRTTTLVSDIEPMDSHVPCSKPTSSSGRKMRCLLCHQFFFFLYFPMFSGDASWSIHWLCFRIFRYPDIPDIHWYPPSKLQDPMTLFSRCRFWCQVNEPVLPLFAGQGVSAKRSPFDSPVTKVVFGVFDMWQMSCKQLPGRSQTVPSSRVYSKTHKVATCGVVTFIFMYWFSPSHHSKHHLDLFVWCGSRQTTAPVTTVLRVTDHDEFVLLEFVKQCKTLTSSNFQLRIETCKDIAP